MISRAQKEPTLIHDPSVPTAHQYQLLFSRETGFSKIFGLHLRILIPATQKSALTTVRLFWPPSDTVHRFFLPATSPLDAPTCDKQHCSLNLCTATFSHVCLLCSGSHQLNIGWPEPLYIDHLPLVYLVYCIVRQRPSYTYLFQLFDACFSAFCSAHCDHGQWLSKTSHYIN